MFINKQLLHLSRGGRKLLILSSVLNFVLLAAKTLTAICTALTVDLIFGKAKVPFFTSLQSIFICMGALIVTIIVLQRTVSVTEQKCSIKIKTALRGQVFKKLFALGPAYTVNRRSGEIAAMAFTKIEWLSPYFYQYLPFVSGTVLLDAVLIAVLFYLDSAVGCICLAGAAGMLGFPMLFFKVMRKRGEKENAAHSKYYADCLDAVQGLPSLKALNADEYQKAKLQKQGEILRVTIMNHLKVTMIDNGVLQLCAAIGGTLSAAVAALRVYAYTNPENIIYMLFLTGACFSPMYLLINIWHLGYRGVTASYAIYDFLNLPVKHSLSDHFSNVSMETEMKEDHTAYHTEDAHMEKEDHAIEQDTQKEKYTDSSAQAVRQVSPVKACTGDIVFKNAVFAYTEETVIDDISFTIPHGTTTALVGASGSGKSTIAHLLAGFYPLKSGTITIGGTVLSEKTVAEIQDLISAVWQDSHMFFGTVYENILIGKPDAAKEEVIEAAAKARIHDFITSLPDGYDTNIGEHGTKFSGGEKQRIAIARAFLRNSPLLIFDEATSSLDRHNEIEIQKSFSELCKGKTVLVIAHRLATIQKAEQICIIRKGKIEAAGTHEQLSLHSEAYRIIMGNQIVKEE